MASLLDVLPIITILAVGGGIWYILRRLGPSNIRPTEYFNICLLLGTFSLIVPMTWIGIQPNGTWTLRTTTQELNIINFPGWSLVFFFVGLILTTIAGYYGLKKLLRALEDFHVDLASFNDYRLILLGFLLLDYLFLVLILPIRGFDALYYYLPEAEVFSQTDRITEVNYLSFLPVVKSPFNVLLYVYSKYVTNEFAIQILPFLFLVGIVLVVYDFSLEIFQNKTMALTSGIFVLTLPFIYWLINYWAFYQDLYLAYFFSVTCYFGYKWYKSPSDWLNGIFVCLGIVMALLSKINGWVLLLILVLWLPTGMKGKTVRIVTLLGLSVFLSIQIATRVFVGGVLPILASLGIAIFLVVKEKAPNEPTSVFRRHLPILIGAVLGSFWLLDRMALSDAVWTEIYETYFRLSQQIKWVYPTPASDPLLHNLEGIHRVNFFSASGILLLGSIFVLPWIILKISSFREYREITPFFIWLLVFFAVWCAYYLTGSIRYLAPLIVPMILAITWGFHQFTKLLASETHQHFWGLFFAFLGTASFYYLIPLTSLSITDQTQKTIGLLYNQVAMSYYSRPEFLVLFAVGFSILLFWFVLKDVNSFPSWIKKRNLATQTKRVLLCTIIIIPIAVQSYLLIYVQGDLQAFQAIHEYEYRDEYQDLVTVIQQQNHPLSAILTVRMPGLQFFTNQPTIDIYYQYSLFPGNPFFESTNLTELLTILEDPVLYIFGTDLNLSLSFSIRFIVVPAVKNIYYDVYLSQIKAKSILFSSIESHESFLLLYNNTDFRLYEFLPG